MNRVALHICGFTVTGLLATSAMGQELTANRSGMGDLRYFAEHCIDAAPSFEEASRIVRTQTQQNILHAQVPTIALTMQDGNCVCSAKFIDWHTHLPDVVQNLHYVVKDEARREWVAAKMDPTEIELDYDGIQAFVRIGYQETQTLGILFVSTTIERQGSCPT